VKPAAPDSCTGIIPLRVLFALVSCALLPLLAFATAPTWWTQRGVTVANVLADDYAPANQGQLKNIAKAAVAEMDAKLPGGAGQPLHDLVSSWSNSSTETNDFAPINLGQLKTVAKPVYDRLIGVKYTETYPWISSGEVPDDFAAINIGQVKNLFSFDFIATNSSHDTDGNGLPDWWEKYYFGTIGIDPSAPAPRGDGLTNLEAFQQQLNPINDDQILSINPERIDETVATGQSITRTIRVKNATNAARQLVFSPHSNATIVNYSYTDSDQQSGPEFVWNDISGTGVHLDSVSDADNGFESFPISFSFPYYGTGYTTVYVASDGFVTLGSGSDYWWGGAMPDSNSPSAMIAAFEDDLNLGASGDVYYQDYGDRVVIQFENAVRYYGDGYVTFQIVLQRDGTITFYYKDMEGIMDGAVVGIQNLATNQGLMIAYYQQYLKSDLAVRITPSSEWQPAPWLQVSPATIALAPGESTDLSVTLDGRTLAPGLFLAGITISSDDPSIMPREIPVTMNLVDEGQLDNDNDGLTNAQERELGTDPNKIDTDGDGMPDGWEVAHGLDPRRNDAAADLDGDGLTNLQEYQRHSDPSDYYNGAAPLVEIVSGDNQTGPPNVLSSQPLIVAVRNANGQALVNAPVSYQLKEGSAQLALDLDTSATANIVEARTDANGVARAYVAFPQEASSISAFAGREGAQSSALLHVFPGPPPNPNPRPRPSPSSTPVPNPSATPPPPLHYLVVDLGENVRPLRIANNGWILIERFEMTNGSWGSQYYRWKAGVYEHLTYSGGGTTVADMNNSGVVIGNGASSNVTQFGLVWPADNSSNPIKISAPFSVALQGYWKAQVRAAHLNVINDQGEIFGGITTSGGFPWGDYYFLQNAYRWPSNGDPPVPLSNGWATVSEPYPGNLVAQLTGSVDTVYRANDRGDYMGLTWVAPNDPFAPTELKMINGSAVDFRPLDLNERGIVLGMNWDWDQAFALDPDGSRTGIGGASYAFAINNFARDGVDDSGKPAKIPAPQVLGYQWTSPNTDTPAIWEYGPNGQYVATRLEDAVLPDGGPWNFRDSHQMWDLVDVSDSGAIITGLRKYDSQYFNLLYWHGLLLQPVTGQLMVDGNRDGKMSSDDHTISDLDQTSSDRPFRFWLNDDEDTAPVPYEGDRVPADQPDYSLHQIKSKRNLEDFARLWINLNGLQQSITSGTVRVGLRWKNVAAGTAPAINIYPSADPAGSDNYLKSDPAAGAQIVGVFNEAIRDQNNQQSVTGGNDFIFKQDYWTGLDGDHPTKCLLFEGAGEGKGELTLVFLDANGTEIGQGGSVWLDLKNIKKMYQRAKGTPEDGIAGPWTDEAAIPTGFEDDPNGQFFEPAPDEEPAVIIYVHGIHPPFFDTDHAYNSNINTAETVYKRLWHNGFKGRFAFYKWPALNPAGFLLNGTGFEFNQSEYRAFKYGSGLAQFVATLPTDYERHIYAHSQGNAVVAAAFENYGLAATTWIVTQGAIPISCFDDDLRHYVFSYNTPDHASSLGYRGFLTDHVNTRIVNFSNDQDSVTGGTWEFDQQWSKPAVELVGLTRIEYWFFSGLGEVHLKKFFNSEQLSERIVSDAHESMAMAVQSRSKSIAHGTDVQGKVNKVVDLHQSFGFGDDHASQWDLPIQTTMPYFEQLLTEIR
jgi:hypothetical protein